MRPMNPELGRTVTRAIVKAKMTTPALHRATGLGESWIKQVRSGRIGKPDPEWLTKLAEEVGADPTEWLALSNQLGAATDYRPAPSIQIALVTALDRQSTAIEALVGLLAKREGITLRDLGDPDSTSLGRVLRDEALRRGANAAIARGQTRELEAPPLPDRKLRSLEPAKP